MNSWGCCPVTAISTHRDPWIIFVNGREEQMLDLNFTTPFFLGWRGIRGYFCLNTSLKHVREGWEKREQLGVARKGSALQTPLRAAQLRLSLRAGTREDEPRC